MLNPDAAQLAVWGDPIAHSRSPILHAAAYRVLGLDWTYARRRVDAGEFTAALGDLDASWRGLSLTMPLKTVAHEAAATRDRRAELTGAVNTLLLGPDGPHGFNTDVGGIVRALADEGVTSLETARIVGAGATATSALVALAELGASRVEVVARRPTAVAPLEAVGEQLGVTVVPVPLAVHSYAPVPVTIATLPGDASVAAPAAAALAAGGRLVDVVYGHWPTALSSAWEAAALPARSGLGMLVHQALLQVRVFTSGDVDTELPHEAEVLAAMRQSVAEH